MKILSKNLIDTYCSTAALISLNNDLMKVILASKDTTFRVRFDNHSSIVWKVPEKIIKEWGILFTKY